MTIALRTLYLLIIFCYTICTNALTTIDITKSNVAPVPLAIPEFIGSENSKHDLWLLHSVIAKDLESTGLFRIIDKDAYIQNIKALNTSPEFQSWRQINANALILGELKKSGRSIAFSYKIWDVFAQKLIVDKTLHGNADSIRSMAHQVADNLYFLFVGDTGYFNTKIAYVSVSKEGKDVKRRLAIMDQDGANHRFLTKGENIVLTPRFSPDLKEIIYLAYNKRHTPRVMSMNLNTGSSRVIGRFSGMSYAPRYTTNGKHVLLAAEKRGISNIYSVNLQTMEEHQLTRCSSICTSPSPSPDGKKVVFNSDMDGSRQLYVMNSDGSGTKRISFNDGFYSGPVWSPRGDLIAFTKMLPNSGFFIGVMKADGSNERIIARGWLVEGATWSPNGRVILFEKIDSRNEHHPQLYSIDISGYNEKMVETPFYASDASWSHLIQ